MLCEGKAMLRAIAKFCEGKEIWSLFVKAKTPVLLVTVQLHCQPRVQYDADWRCRIFPIRPVLQEPGDGGFQ